LAYVEEGAEEPQHNSNQQCSSYLTKRTLRNTVGVVGCLVLIGVAAALYAHQTDLADYSPFNIEPSAKSIPKQQAASKRTQDDEAALAFDQLAYQEKKAEADAMKQPSMALDQVVPEVPVDVNKASSTANEQAAADKVLARARDPDTTKAPDEVTPQDQSDFKDVTKQISQAKARAVKRQARALKARRSTEDTEHQVKTAAQNDEFTNKQLNDEYGNGLQGDELVRWATVRANILARKEKKKAARLAKLKKAAAKELAKKAKKAPVKPPKAVVPNDEMPNGKTPPWASAKQVAAPKAQARTVPVPANPKGIVKDMVDDVDKQVDSKALAQKVKTHLETTLKKTQQKHAGDAVVAGMPSLVKELPPGSVDEDTFKSRAVQDRLAEATKQLEQAEDKEDAKPLDAPEPPTDFIKQ